MIVVVVGRTYVRLTLRPRRARAAYPRTARAHRETRAFGAGAPFINMDSCP